MTKTIPEVRIKYAWLLAGQTAEVLNDKYGDGTPVAPPERLLAVADKYREWWAPHSDEILHGLCDILGLEFRQNIIDVYIAPWFSPMSDPMVIGPAFRTEDALVNTITHELIHRLLTDNTSIPYEHDFLADWRKLFGDQHAKNTLVHIPVHAVTKKLYLDVINRPDLLALDQETVRNNAPYATAWKYVNEREYTEMVRSLAASKSP